jgi:hypothetical protein
MLKLILASMIYFLSIPSHVEVISVGEKINVERF